MLKKSSAIAIFAGVCMVMALTLSGFLAAFGGESTPGTSDDPLVSKSYVDSRTTYTVVHMQANQKLIGGAGAEIILRSGEATAIGNGSNGVSDMTDGKDLMTTDKVGTNHLLLVPRDDGRGIQVWTESYVMVRGSYSVQ